MQDTFLAGLAGRRRFAGRAAERTWLTGILKRKVIDWLRERVRRDADRPLPADGRTEQLFTRAGKWRTAPDEWSPDDPGREVTRAEFRAALADCLDALPDRLRRAFVLRHLADAAVDDIRADLGASAENVWVMLHRGRLRVWRCLSVKWFGEPPEGGP